MDTIFQLEDSDRARLLFHSLGASYLCLWLHVPPQNYLQCKFRFYPDDFREQHPHSSSSFGCLARHLFEQYCMQTIFLTDHNGVVPGLAFKTPSPCIELRESELQQLASSDVQRQFYQTSRIKTALFMGCRSGEIELGFSIDPQMNLEMELRKLFPEDFQSMNLPLLQIPPSLQDHPQHSRPSSSSSRSMDSTEYPSYLFNSSTMREAPLVIKQPNASISTSPIHQNPFQSFPTPESINSAIANAILATLNNPVSPSPSTVVPDLQGNRVRSRGELSSAFTSCRPMGPRVGQASSPGFRRQTMMKKVLSFYRGLNITRLQQHQAARVSGAGLTRPTTNQLHHVISERKRREKINESFQALRSLLPPGTKKDKATVLRTTKEYMSSLKDQISELHRRNQLLDSQISSLVAKGDNQNLDTISSGRFSPNSTNERVHVTLTPVMESSSSEERRTVVRVSVHGDGRSMIDLVMRLLGFLKDAREVRLASMDAQTVMVPSIHEEQQQQQQTSLNRVTLRLVIEDYQWDQSAFLEAIRRVIADLSR